MVIGAMNSQGNIFLRKNGRLSQRTVVDGRLDTGTLSIVVF
jgi:hypothetical protein